MSAFGGAAISKSLNTSRHSKLPKLGRSLSLFVLWEGNKCGSFNRFREEGCHLRQRIGPFLQCWLCIAKEFSKGCIYTHEYADQHWFSQDPFLEDSCVSLCSENLLSSVLRLPCMSMCHSNKVCWPSGKALFLIAQVRELRLRGLTYFPKSHG